jgi:hypothetical protein
MVASITSGFVSYTSASASIVIVNARYVCHVLSRADRCHHQGDFVIVHTYTHTRP